jgi:hypothetical protein
MPELSRASHILSHDERTAIGKTLRDKLPRNQHATWKRSETRADLIALLRRGSTTDAACVRPVSWAGSRHHEMLLIYARACGWVLARAHAKASDVSSIAGYLGSSDQYDEAMGDFVLAYADQAERDFAALKAAVRKGRIVAYQET